MDETALDQALECALTDRDFGTIRQILRGKGYALAEDESEPDLMKALQLDETDKAEEDDDRTCLLTFEKEIRTRQLQTLRHLLFLDGYNIKAPDPVLLKAEEDERRRTGRPIYVPHSSLDLV